MEVKLKYKLRALRVGMGYSASEFSKQCGITRQYLSLLELGKCKNPSIALMKKMAELLGTTPQELFFED